MIPYLQEQPMPNPFTDVPDVPAPPQLSAMDWAEPPLADVVPRFIHEDVVKSLEKQIAERDAEIKKLCVQLAQRSPNVGAAQSATNVMHLQRDPGKSRTERENDAVYRLCAAFPQINTVDFAPSDYASELMCCVVTNNGKHHYSTAEMNTRDDPILVCEGRMRDFLRKQGYGAKVSGIDKMWLDEADTLGRRTVSKDQGLLAAGKITGLPPTSPGQPVHSIQKNLLGQVGNNHANSHAAQQDAMQQSYGQALNQAMNRAQATINANRQFGMTLDQYKAQDRFPDGSKI